MFSCHTWRMSQAICSSFFQLDAAELDSEIFTLTKGQLSKLFKYQQVIQRSNIVEVIL